MIFRQIPGLLPAMAPFPIMLLLTLLAVGCVTRTSEPNQERPAPVAPTSTATPDSTHEGPGAGPIMQAAIDPSTLYPESLDQMIYRSDLIVRASLVSVTAATEALSGGEGASPTYRPLHELKFTVHEYLKGSGTTEVLVVIRPRYRPGSSISLPWSLTWHTTEAEAREEADRLIARRNRTWDDRQALLFLNRVTSYGYGDWYDMSKVIPSSGESRPIDTFVFPLSESEFRPVWDYAIDTLSRVWLPANSTDVPADIATMEFITDGAVSPHPVISLAAFRSQKAELEATLKAGEGIEGYVECIVGKIWREQHMRANPDWPSLTAEKALDSGMAGGTEFFRESEEDSRAADYHNYWLSGDDMDLFRAVRVDDDSDPKNGYDDLLQTTRPLPAGVYRVRHNKQHYANVPCNYKPDDSYVAWTVISVAPPGAIHEAFFDPVKVGSAVLANATNGVLKPQTFTRANGTSATLTSVAYESGTVKIKVTPDDALTGHFVDFIELDGSVSLSLDVAAATVDATNDTLSWSAASQPWDDGDKLMVRLRRNPASCSGGVAVPNPDNAHGLVKDCEALLWAKETLAGTGTLNWGEETAISSWDGVTVGGTPQRVTALRLPSKGLTGTLPARLGHLEKLSNLDLGSNQLTGEIPFELGRLSGLTRLRLAGNRFGGCVPAALRDVSDHDFDVLGLEYCAPVAPAPGHVYVVLSDGSFTVNWTSVDGAEQYHVQYRTGGTDDGWIDLGSRIFTIWTFTPIGGLSCETTYEFRVQARGDGTTYSTEWGEPSASTSHTTGTCPNRPPVFESDSYSFSVPEDAGLWSSVGRLKAIDPDAGDTSAGTLFYHITAGNEAGKFRIVTSHLDAEIVVLGALDYETVSSYTLTVEARDGKEGGTSSVTVEITVRNVPEGMPSVPENLSVSLSDGSISISWDSVTGAGSYRVQYRTGGSSGEWTNLDRITDTSMIFNPEGGVLCATTYDFRVQARGDGVIHVADWGAASESVSHTTEACNQVPAFGSATYDFAVSEDAASGAAVGTVSATDPDAGDGLTYSITAGNGEGAFAVGSSTGSITVAGSLDYETTVAYRLTVEASDGRGGEATATVEIEVGNVAEAGPPVPNGVTYTYNPPAGTFDFSLRAMTGVDMYRVQYRVGGAEGTWINLDATTETNLTFAPEGGPVCGTTYEFRIQAHGDGETYPAVWGTRTGGVTYETPACNSAPEFGAATYEFSVPEDAATGTAVGTVSATDPDDGDTVAYSITAGNGDGKFAIDGSGGSITVAAALDYETTSSYTLTVQASDGKDDGSSSVTVEITVGNVAETKPPAPQNLSAAATHNSVSLSWDAPADPTVTGYRILRRRPDHGEVNLLVHVSNTGSTLTTYTDTAVTASTRYVYRVEAINAKGVGPYSNPASITTAQQP